MQEGVGEIQQREEVLTQIDDRMEFTGVGLTGVGVSIRGHATVNLGMMRV